MSNCACRTDGWTVSEPCKLHIEFAKEYAAALAAERDALRSRLAKREARLLKAANDIDDIATDHDLIDVVAQLREVSRELRAADQPAEDVVREQRAQWQSRLDDTAADQPPAAMSTEEHCRLFCAWKGGGPCLAKNCPRAEEMR